MKKVLLATSVLALTTGFAAAEITLSGSARMGVIDDFGDDNTGFTSRARVEFTLSGETDGGLSFGASFRADNASAANSGNAGSVFISGAFGKLTMGDIDGAAQQAVGNVDGVGLTGLGDLNEAIYLHNLFDEGGLFVLNSDPTAAYEYSAGGFTGIISVSNPDNLAGADISATYALGLKYVAGDYTFSLGYEDNSDLDSDHIIVGANATFGAVTVKANYGQATFLGTDIGDQWHLSATYTADALAVTAFIVDEFDAEAYGLGASYDLGGGAKFVGGYAKNDSADTDAFDLGLSFSF